MLDNSFTSALQHVLMGVRKGTAVRQQREQGSYLMNWKIGTVRKYFIKIATQRSIVISVEGQKFVPNELF